MKHTVEHDLDFDVVKKTLGEAFLSYQQRYGHYYPELVWDSERHARVGFRVKGMTLAGTIDLLPNALDIELEVPFVFRVFKQRALVVIDREIARWVQRAKAEQAKRG